MNGSLFSDSWFKVARLRVSLHGSVEIQKQVYRGETWYVVRSGFNDEFFRVTPETYDFIASLTTGVTVEEHWERFLDEYGNAAPTQDEVIQVLGELYAHNLLYFQNVPDSLHAFERKSEKKRRERWSTLLSLLSIKIPLGSPERLLVPLTPLFRHLFGMYAALAWLVVVAFGARAAITEWGALADATQGFLAPANLAYMYAALILMKLGHESAHAAAVKRFGGSVRMAGVMFLVLTPLPYVDASESWFFRERRQRLLVSAAGMLFDLFAAALAALVWSRSGDGIVHSVAFNVMILGSVSSVFFNGNPLLRFDAYYLLTDLIEIPNLYERARRIWHYYAERYLFGVQVGEHPAGSLREELWLGGYGAVSFAYRCVLSVTIVLMVADRILVLGIVMAVVSLVAGIVLPARRLMVYLSDSPRLTGHRGRAVAVSLGAAALITVLVALVPLPRTIRAPGVIEQSGYLKVYAATEGKLERVLHRNGDYVDRGGMIAVLSNFDLERDLDVTRARLGQTTVMKQKALADSAADLKPLAERTALFEKQLDYLAARKRELKVVAETSGVFVSPVLESYQGRWLKRQTQLGTLLGPGEARFSAIVSQDQAFDLFRSSHMHGIAKLFGSAGHELSLSGLAVIPYQKEELPSAALGWLGGGDVAVSSSDRSGKKTTEPFYKVTGVLRPQSGDERPRLLHGRSGILRISLPSEPLIQLVYRKVRQTLQKRYKI